MDVPSVVTDVSSASEISGGAKAPDNFSRVSDPADKTAWIVADGSCDSKPWGTA
jgi:hypothetical protein